MNIQTADYWIKHLDLQPHPEGGYYKEVFRSQQQVLRAGETIAEKAVTSIYYLLEGNDYSGFHRIASDELWYFHKGVPLYIHVIDTGGNYYTHELSDTGEGSLSIVIEAGLWFAAAIPSGTGFTLVSCAVAPGFEFSKFEMADKQQMKASYPKHSAVLDKLCR
jgi:predicted cupin superfamily sugar epimerase